uniref:Adenosine kinase n=1 Tax=Timema shepardi TaxID=629360 RepID=A0A7R9AWH0_TIMSH|nr:unnamed protein product [Timema shepardi]
MSSPMTSLMLTDGSQLRADGFEKEGLVLGLGNPLLDISANVDSEFLKKYGMKPNDAILAEEKHKPIYDEMIKKYDVEYTAGGSVQNALRVAQTTSEPWLLSSCAVLVTDNGHNRSLCANLAAANHFTIDHIHKLENKILMENAQYFYISGFFLTVSPPTIIEVAKHALEKNALFMMNLSAPFISQFFNEPLMRAMPYVDILFGNDSEAEAFAKQLNFETTDLSEIALKITQLPKLNTKRKRIVIITNGSKPVLLAKDGIVNEFPVKQLLETQVVDTNGAGDAFVGGFLAQLVQGKSLETCIRCGIWTATHVVQRSGCTFDQTQHFKE